MKGMSAEERERFEAAKSASVAQLLFKCSRLLNERAIEEVRRRFNLPGLRPAHTTLFPHIDLDGTRLTELAKRVGISKQGVGQLVEEMVRMGGLERRPDPRDGRAKLICFPSDEGFSLFSGLAVLADLEQSLAEEIGADRMRDLHETLRSLLNVLDGGDRADAGPP